MIINEKTWAFVSQHANDDVRTVALKGTKDPEVDMSIALQQIAGRQTARYKLPSWSAVDGIVYPPHLNLEQCSSEQTARYKGSLLTKEDGNNVFVDLTGGFGVDFFWMSQGFSRRIYVEQDAALCAVAEHNFQLLGLTSTVCCADGITYLKEMERADVIYLDPARRNQHGGRTYDIRDCTPNVLELLPILRQKAHTIIVKLSPMFDWRKAVADLGCVAEVHIVSVGGECKELVVVLRETDKPLRVVCVNDDEVFECSYPFQQSCAALPSPITAEYLYEPNASIMKAGCFAELATSFHVKAVADNSHLFLSSVEIDNFPGRKFQIFAISSADKKDIKKQLSPVDFSLESANITVRNFPMTADQLRKKLKIKDGGDTYIFATTLANGQHKLFICRKIG